MTRCSVEHQIFILIFISSRLFFNYSAYSVDGSTLIKSIAMLFYLGLAFLMPKRVMNAYLDWMLKFFPNATCLMDWLRLMLKTSVTMSESKPAEKRHSNRNNRGLTQEEVSALSHWTPWKCGGHAMDLFLPMAFMGEGLFTKLQGHSWYFRVGFFK